ncbi:phage tail tip lysozyme [Pseudomonas knackmussii]|uniref:phage tail tip lysozyme n=1 Tax=Pseudomonas knackmussii TaxID=65741 RepID=UPI001362A2C9|nr:phage tail tip lysozyme [Pseudomonas knackmussii]
MATVIDALIVTLGLDSSGFKKGEKEAADAQKRFVRESEVSAKQIAAQAKIMSEGFRRVRNELLGLFAVAIGANGLKDFISNAVKGQAELGYLSKNLGMSARELDAWGKTVKTVGGSAEGFQASLQNIASGIEAFKLGEDSPVVGMFRAIGVNVADSAGKMRPFKDVLLDVADALQKYDAQDQIKIAQSLGIDQGTLNVLRQGRQAVQDLYGEMYKSSGVTEESVKRAQEAQRVWGEFTAQANGVGQAIFEAMGPALVELTKDLRDFGSWVNEHRTEIQKFFTDLVEGGKEMVQMLRELDQDTGGATTKILALGAAFAVASKGLGMFLGMGTGALAMASRLGALGIAGYGGYQAGTYLNDNFISGTSAGDFIGEWLNRGAAALGVQSAQDSVNSMDAAAGKVNGGRAMADYVANYFQSKGWSREQAVGIASNLSVESGFNPSAVGDGGKAYGLAQWHPDRQAGFRAFAGKDIRSSSLDEQLAFIHYELTQGQEKSAGDALRKARSAYEAGGIVSRQYERPARADVEASRRGMLAQSIYGNTAGDQFQMTAEERLALQRDQMGVRPGEMRLGAGANFAPGPSSTTNNEVSIGQVVVNTQATDAPGIARDMGEALRQNQLINSSATGMN